MSQIGEARQETKEAGKEEEGTPPKGRRARKRQQRRHNLWYDGGVNKKAKDKDAVRNYAIQHVPGAYLNFSRRQILASDWNALIRAGSRITLRRFAARHGLKYETWRRKYLRGATGTAVPAPKDTRRRKYEHLPVNK